jgi:ligand-binding SRPBCC domain-containing protein
VRLELATHVCAPPERCFDLARSVDFHCYSTAPTGERAVGGRLSGLLGLGEEVTWEARHFGVRQRLTSRITAFDRPRHFRDSMVRGAFAWFDHDHFFVPEDGGTRMTDLFAFASPLGPLGRIADRLVVSRYMRHFLQRRNHHLKTVAESNEWVRFLS